MSRYRKHIIKGIFVLSLIILAVVLADAPRIIMDRFGPSNAHAAVDNTKEIMATCLTDAKELWVLESGQKRGDGDKIGIAIIAAKLFEARYLQSYIE